MNNENPNNISKLHKEKIDRIISESILIPGEWKNDVKEFAHSLVNLAFTIGNENFFYGATKLESQTSLTHEEKLTKYFLLLVPEIKKVVAKSSNKKVSDYHKVEVSLVEKINKLFSAGEIVEGGARLLKMVEISKRLSTDEIIVLKKKLKALVVQQGMKFSNIQGLSKVQEIIKPVLDLMDVVMDEKLVKDAINLFGGYLEKCAEKDKNPFRYSSIVEMLLNEELRNLIGWLTNNLNKLASERVEDNNISQEVLDRIVINIGQALGDINHYPQPQPQPGDTPNDFYGKLRKALTKIDLQELKNALTTVQSKGKWYQNPTNIGCLAVSGTLLSGLLVWFFLKRKKQSKYENTKK